MNTRTKRNIESIRKRIDGFRWINTIQFQDLFNLHHMTALKYMKRLKQDYPEHFELGFQNYRGKPIYVLYNKDYQP